MPFIGNDIVDLDLPDNRKKIPDRRFLDRVFTADEQKFIAQHAQNAALVWALWAGKESAYKALSKSVPGIPSIPRRYRVVFSVAAADKIIEKGGRSVWNGAVETPAGSVLCRVLLTPDYVHCLAIAGGCLSDERLIQRVLRWNQNEDLSAGLRRMAIERLAFAGEVCPSAIEIVRQQTPKGLGPPRVFVNGSRSATDITLSHDGRWGAFALFG